MRWSAFGLRGRIVGAVLVTGAISLGVAALVLLPRLHASLVHASKTTLKTQVYAKANKGLIRSLDTLPYRLIPDRSLLPKGKLQREAAAASKKLLSATKDLIPLFGQGTVTLIGDIDAQGSGQPILPTGVAPQGVASAATGQPGNIKTAFQTGKPEITLGYAGGEQVVFAAIPVKGNDAVLAVSKSIDNIPGAVDAVRHAFEIAAAVAILLTILLAIPLAGQLVSRLQRLRQAALQLAIGGTVADFPADRGRDEVGDLSRSFAIMQRRLRQQEEARRAFVATASHELRTPLASLEGMLELLADDLQGEQPDLDDAAALLDRARAQSHRLSRLAADLLDLSRIDAEVALRSEPIELSELSRAVAAEFEQSSANRGVAIALDDGGRPAWALADPGSVARILRILLDNALRVAPEGSEIRIDVRAGAEPTLSVSDRGPGVAQEERAQIFERFKRGRATGGEAGFGLGLAIGRELAQRMGGSLVLADGDEQGATFRLRLQPTEAPSAERIASAAGV